MQSFCEGSQITVSPTSVDGAVTAEWREATGDEANQLARAGRAADLLVFGRAWGESSPQVLNTALMEAGRPLLIVPPNPPAHIGNTVVVAWKDCAEAASAVAIALPLLASAKQVVILSITEDAKADKSGGDRLREALAWHNPVTKLERFAKGRSELPDTLLKAAADLGADLLVMGAHSHSRPGEVVFGGVTRRGGVRPCGWTD